MAQFLQQVPWTPMLQVQGSSHYLLNLSVDDLYTHLPFTVG
ncbi:MAG: hypothetical protein P8185_21030 [Deltaproteobacteria bacterium]